MVLAKLKDMQALMFPKSMIDREVAIYIQTGGIMWTMAKATAKTLANGWRNIMSSMPLSNPFLASDKFRRMKTAEILHNLLYDMAIAVVEKSGE